MLNLVIMKSFSRLQSVKTRLSASLVALILGVFTIAYLTCSTEDTITRPVADRSPNTLLSYYLVLVRFTLIISQI